MLCGCIYGTADSSLYYCENMVKSLKHASNLVNSKKFILYKKYIFIKIVSKTFDNNIPVDIIFLDFAEAFDTVLHEILCIKLAGYGTIGDLLNWCKAFLKNRLQRVVLRENIFQ
ncbi:uncharacterized protein LOC124816140 [Hydra vulgaris]|uniref:uncharacterized protein LOC124816140 n=1 Tax=Hydra vulgaris TaxID=6087 RepID=UPI001F5E418C|nr:uncharacterized protein LOC124816140 [Hydra vulgaris]